MSRAPRPFRANPRHPLTGRQIQISARTSRELEARLHHLETLREEHRLDLRSVEDIDRTIRRLVHGKVTLERAATAYARQAALSDNTRRRLRSFLDAPGHSLRMMVLDELSPAIVQDWLDRLAATGSARSYVVTVWRTLRAVSRYATRRGWIGRSPWGDWRPKLGGTPARMREAARDSGELVSLLKGARALGPPELECKIAACALLGLRQGELAGLRWSDVDEAALSVTIARQWDGARTKHGKVNLLRALPELFVLLNEQKSRLEAENWFACSGPIFPDPHASFSGNPRAYTKGQCLAISSLRAVVEFCELPESSRWSVHSLRDTFVTLESRSVHAGDLKSLADRSRHASIASLVRYLRARTREPPPPGFTLAAGAGYPALPGPQKKLGQPRG